MSALKRYSQTVVAGALGLALLAGVYALAMKQGWRWDATATRQHSLDPQSATILRNLNATVEAIAFFNPEEQQLKQKAEALFDLVSRETDRLSVEYVDPDRAPFRARELGVTMSGSVVLASGDKRETITFVDEEKLVNAIARVTSGRQARVYHVSGHGETDLENMQELGAGQLAKALRDQGAVLEPLTLAASPDVPADADLLVVLAPARDFLDRELTALDAYLARGGRLFLALAPEKATNLDPWLTSRLGLERKPGMVVDPAANQLIGDALAVLVQQYPVHPVTRDFTLLTIFPTAGALAEIQNATVAGNASLPLEISPVGLTTPQAWLENDVDGLAKGRAQFDKGPDIAGPLWIAAAVAARKAEANATAHPLRAFVVADQDFLTNRYSNIYGNLDLARNAMHWLLEREGLISVRKPDAPNVFLTLSTGQRLLLTWVPVALLPLGLFGLAVAMAIVRKRSR